MVNRNVKNLSWRVARIYAQDGLRLKALWEIDESGFFKGGRNRNRMTVEERIDTLTNMLTI